MDDCYWEELAELDPVDVCRRGGAEQKKGGYLIRVLGREYLLSASQRKMRRVEAGQPTEVAAATLSCVTVHYLIKARDIPRSGQLVAASELRGGKPFFAAGAHSPDFAPLAELFSTSWTALQQAAQALGGRTVPHGDAAVEVRALPRLPITYVFWEGDEEFPASVSMLFDRTADQHLPLDMILAIGQETMRQLVSCTREEAGVG